MPTPQAIPDLKTLKEIYQSQQSYTRKTPLIPSEELGARVQGKVFVKAESLQKTGAFKFRGALYRLLQLTEQEKLRGVVAYSSGNFARGLAAAGEILGIEVHLVMPADAPKNKIDNARAHGAEVKLCYESTPSREEAAAAQAIKLSQQHGYSLLHPFDDAILIRGQSAVAMEASEQLQQMGETCHFLLCPTGGGSLVAGSSMVFNAAHYPDTQVLAIEPSGYEGMTLSIEEGQRARAYGKTASSCDALQALSPGEANLAIIQNSEVAGLAVDEAFVNEGIRFAAYNMKLVLEPSGAIGIGALLQHPEKFRGKTSVIIASGGNIDIEKYARIIQR
ncbi:threonine/serine dehydratase [Endozoicomonas sp. 4G]|uniref:threonine ammonia-lyase n=1 Tax=Endozoicomonas sp. 4G TaxID=2872754 RepID=UPI0020787A7F|nr:threonine/serine dehydratase [Endozoicomonas sp. 4G]